MGCSNDVLNKQFDEEDVTYLSNENNIFDSGKELKLLNQSDQVATSSIPFTLVKAFIPDDSYVKTMNIQGSESFTYLTLAHGKSAISGKVVVENSTDEAIEFQAVFLQGNKATEFKPKDSKEWSKSLNFSVPSKTSMSLPVEVAINKEGMQELSFVPIEKVPSNEKLSNETINNFRFFLQLDDVNIDNNSLEEQSFELNNEQIASLKNPLPSPEWYGKDKKEVTFIEEDGEFFSKQSVEGIKLNQIPYSTSVDVVLFDEYGNSSLIKENVSIKKNEESYISLNEDLINEMYDEKMRQYIMVTNNREEDILADIRALKDKQKPFPTSYQGIIELHPVKK